MSNIQIIAAIQGQALNRNTGVDTDHTINEEYKELAKRKRPTFDMPYTETDPLR